jgi:hypothetical protein
MITPAGLSLLSDLDSTVTELNKKLFGSLGTERLAALIELLEQVREQVERASANW